MPLYNVDLTLKCTMVVQADDEDDAHEEALYHWREGVSDSDARPTLHITGEVTKESHLRDGWDGMCIPYGGNGNTRIKDLLHATPAT